MNSFLSSSKEKPKVFGKCVGGFVIIIHMALLAAIVFHVIWKWGSEQRNMGKKFSN